MKTWQEIMEDAMKLAISQGASVDEIENETNQQIHSLITQYPRKYNGRKVDCCDCCE